MKNRIETAFVLTAVIRAIRAQFSRLSEAYCSVLARA